MSVPYVLAVRADSPYRTLQDLLADAKAKPNTVAYGSVGVGSGHHILGETLSSRAGAQMIHVPYKGGAENMLALLGGQTTIAFESSAAFPFVDSGKVRLLATFGSKRLSRFPSVPTASELGYDVVYTSPLGIAGPKNMPAQVVKTVHDAFLAATKDPEYQATLAKFELVPEYRNTAIPRSTPHGPRIRPLTGVIVLFVHVWNRRRLQAFSMTSKRSACILNP